MGDKGGKKDKAKNKQQQVKKHQDDEQRKHEKHPQDPIARSQPGAVAAAKPRV